MFRTLASAMLSSTLFLPSPAQAAEQPSHSSSGVAPDDEDGKAPASALERARDLGLSADDVRPDQQKETTLLGKPLILGGELSLGVRGRSGYDLQSGAKDDDVRITPEAKLEAIWLPSNSSVVFASVRAEGENDIYRQGRNRRNSSGLAIDNLWWLKTGLFDTPLAIQVGRQRLRERREFWWDDSIDAVRIHYFGKDVRAYAGIGRPLAHLSTQGRMDPEEKGLLRIFGNLDWKWQRSQHVELFILHQGDRSHRYVPRELVERSRADRRDARLSWVGARIRGCVKPGFPRRLCYWGDIARVRGTELEYDLDGVNGTQQIVDAVDRKFVRGWAYDAGVNLELPLAFRPVITLGQARGSGDRPGTPDRDLAFRQTGLHRNDSRNRGISRFRTYGEVLRPDLSNTTVTSAALGIPVGNRSWLELIGHRYRQPHADNRIAGAAINANPAGRDRRLGHEIDLVASHRPRGRWEFELTAGAFRAGPAFSVNSKRWAGLLELRVDYNF
jgi:hypothetical protein